MVLPKWVTQLGALFAGIALSIEALQQAGVLNLIPTAVSLVVIGIGGVATALGTGLGDDDSDGIINWFDSDWRK